MEVIEVWYRKHRRLVLYWCWRAHRRWFRSLGVSVDELESLVWYMLTAYERDYVGVVKNAEGFLRCRVWQYCLQELLRVRGFNRKYKECRRPGSNGKMYTRKARTGRVCGDRERFGLSRVFDQRDEEKGVMLCVVASREVDPAAAAAAAEAVALAFERVPPCYRDRYANVVRALAEVG